MTSNTHTVQKIENGYVIDHIPPGKNVHILKLLGLHKSTHEIYSGRNVPSKKHGTKDFLKIVGAEFSDLDFNRIALVAPNATVNRIENFSLTEKQRIAIPERIENILVCPNVNCIANHEPFIKTVFTRAGSRFTCAFCEYTFTDEEIAFL